MITYMVYEMMIKKIEIDFQDLKENIWKIRGKTEEKLHIVKCPLNKRVCESTKTSFCIKNHRVIWLVEK